MKAIPQCPLFPNPCSSECSERAKAAGCELERCSPSFYRWCPYAQLYGAAEKQSSARGNQHDQGGEKRYRHHSRER